MWFLCILVYLGMKIDILTLFPKMFEGPFEESIIKRALDKKLVEINIYDLREYGLGKHKVVDGRPYGGGKGMVLMVEPMANAVKDLQSRTTGHRARVILLSPQGRVFVQAKARELAKMKHIILIAGRYEGFDERIRRHLVDEELSIGKYILTGGELPAMVVSETVARLVPGVLEKVATDKESFSTGGNIEHPQYTRPENFNGWEVPEVLLSGNHAEIEKWKRYASKRKSLRD